MEQKWRLFNLIKRNIECGNMKENLYRKIYFPDGNTNTSLEFSPQKDIIAYELSLLQPLLIKPRRSIKEIKDKLDLMPVSIMRHIK